MSSTNLSKILSQIAIYALLSMGSTNDVMADANKVKFATVAPKGSLYHRTLQEIGEVFNLTRMRICQIEKSILGKLKSSLPE